MIISFVNSPFSIMDEYCMGISGFVQGTTITGSNLVCKRYSSTSIIIQGYATIIANTPLSFTTYLITSTASITTYNSAQAYIQVYSAANNLILNGYTNTLSSYAVTQGSYKINL
jgi:hypothetical protein